MTSGRFSRGGVRVGGAQDGGGRRARAAAVLAACGAAAALAGCGTHDDSSGGVELGGTPDDGAAGGDSGVGFGAAPGFPGDGRGVTFAPGGAAASSIALSRDGARVFVAGTDHARVFVVDAWTRAVLGSASVGERPTSLAVGPDDRIFVANTGSRSVTVLEGAPVPTAVAHVAVGAEPVGLVVSAETDVVVVTCRTSDAVHAFRASTLEPLWVSAVAPRPEALALTDDGFAVVGHGVASRLSVLRVSTGAVLGASALNDKLFGGRGGFAQGTTRLTAVTALLPVHVDFGGEDAGTRVLALSMSAETDARPVMQALATQPAPGPATPPPAPDADDPPPADAGGSTDLPPIPAEPGREGGGYSNVGMSVEIAPGASDSFVFGDSTSIGSIVARFGNVDTAGSAGFHNPSAAVLEAGGRFAVVTARGSDRAMVIGILPGTSQTLPIGIVPTGAGPRGAVFSADGRVLIVESAFDYSLSWIPLPANEFALAARGLSLEELPGTVHTAYAESPLPAPVLAGRRLFFSAADARMASRAGTSCASCHPDGRDDGLVFRFLAGPRNTPSLAGGLSHTLPLHWAGDLPTQRELQGTVRGLMGGHGLGDAELDALAAYMDTIPLPDNPRRDDPATADARARGAAIFAGKAQCAGCHAGGALTDNGVHAVGSADEEDPFAEGDTPAAVRFNTPTLRGLFTTAPYLHDGRAVDLEAVLTTYNPGDSHGATYDLSRGELDDLIAYLLSL